MFIFFVYKNEWLHLMELQLVVGLKFCVFNAKTDFLFRLCFPTITQFSVDGQCIKGGSTHITYQYYMYKIIYSYQ